jgi:hypothetical protein
MSITKPQETEPEAAAIAFPSTPIGMEGASCQEADADGYENERPRVILYEFPRIAHHLVNVGSTKIACDGG